MATIKQENQFRNQLSRKLTGSRRCMRLFYNGSKRPDETSDFDVQKPHRSTDSVVVIV